MTASGQLVVFGLNNQQYALTISSVSEIIRMLEITRIPNMQHYYKGIINLRGSVVPVMSLSLRLGLEENELDKDSRIIVTEMEGKKLGLIVDNVYSVTRYSEEEVSDPGSANDESRFIKGIVRHGDVMLLLLDLNEVMN